MLWRTEDGTAKAGEDYESRSGTLFWEANNTNNFTKGILIPLIDDGLDEPEEIFKVILSHPIYVQYDDPKLTNERGSMELTVTIQDDNEPSGLYFQPMARVLEGSPASTQSVSIAVRWNEVSGQTVSVDYATSDDSAIQEQDYRFSSGTLTRPAEAEGESLEKTMMIPILRDNRDEQNKTFYLDLSNPQNIELGK